ncbi:cobalamin biosynthesis protein CbiD [Selenomonas sp. oral taxon 137 str. F0430]|jgi:cobalamin biosynthesis protein cbiD|uniref:cobalt-precorrin-5B (C(1))-methyltransferase CbiD n=1 Tax=unclassified Selenomonas TaxID=2637378 RepID=UPI0001EB2C83|nr:MULTISPECIES: cobalt-precorrin-5B (C(1))-methyltransferase CbiD [unclassified Selenomonas]EFR40220.1 cobalamin biosynthesis protein CbiD [Selenomonas sp. oral taxon 137 str. F0430]EJP31274.1 cobalamin biosynthesis protein CbiD [Selenomonas sp. FOBRC9]
MAKAELRSGYTTGACAAAGVKAAFLFRAGEDWHEVELMALDGTPLTIPVKAVEETPDGIRAEVVKFSGDDPDITNGASVFTTLTLRNDISCIEFRAGEGVGTVTKRGMSLPVGEPSINKGPRELIRRVVEEMTGSADFGAVVTISIPAGVELAKKTLNPVLGIEGGISVIGTTGVLRPMSEEAFKDSLVPQIDVALAAGLDTLVFVPGKIGERIALAIGVPQEAAVETSNFIGFMLDSAAERGVKNVVILGHTGKLVKIAAGVFHTHNRVADARLETLAAYAAAEGMSTEGVRTILASNTTEDAMECIAAAGLADAVCAAIAERVHVRAERYLFGKVRVGAIMVNFAGDILGVDAAARAIAREHGWRL